MNPAQKQAIKAITDGNTALGIELGSTRIKAVLIDSGNFSTIAAGGYDWENRLTDGIWTYSLTDVWTVLQSSYKRLNEDVQNRYGIPLVRVGSLGISAMMHGYLAFADSSTHEARQLVPFRTWRNTITAESAEILTKLFNFNVPQRWSIAHLYQAILNGENHVGDIDFITTLAGYVHWKLTGLKVLGVGDASGMFPIDSTRCAYNAAMIEQFNELAACRKFKWKLQDILPEVLSAGGNAGYLTMEGAKLLDPSGGLQAGIPLCPPEGDAGTGMVATNSVLPHTGNVSAGTSIFAMLVLEKELSGVYTEIDMVTTPSGSPVAMVHCNNCTSDIDAWIKLFGEAAALAGAKIDKPRLYDLLYNKALEGDSDCGGLLSYNYYSGEPITQTGEGRPLFLRAPDSRLTLANFMRTTLFSAMCTLKLGMNILTEKERVHIERLLGHGGLFKTKLVGQKLMAAALNVPISVMESAGEGGAWGIALLAEYTRRCSLQTETLETFLTSVFANITACRILPDKEDAAGFNKFMELYTAGLAIERAACKYF